MIEWVCHVDMTTDPKEAQYNRIVGMDLMNKLGIDISFSTQKIVWAGATLPMCLQRILVANFKKATEILLWNDHGSDSA